MVSRRIFTRSRYHSRRPIARLATICAIALTAGLCLLLPCRPLHLPQLDKVLPGLPHTAAAKDELAGRPHIIDGDTLRLGDRRDTQRIRLFGIDAPEHDQTCTDNGGHTWSCGIAATQALRNHIGAQEIRCQPRDTDHYGRVVAVCYAGQEDLNEWMVREGWAVAYRQYSRDYLPAEADAHTRHAGIWAGQFEQPSQWRRERRSR